MPGTVDPQGFLVEIQNAIIRVLDPDAAFDGVPLLPEYLGDLENAIQIVFGKLNICVVVQARLARATSSNTPGMQFLVPITIEIIEDTYLNRFPQNINARHYWITAVKALALLWHTVPKAADGEPVATAIYPDPNNSIEDISAEFDREKFPNIGAARLNLFCTCGVIYEPQQTLLDGNNQALLDSMGIYLTVPRPFDRS